MNLIDKIKNRLLEPFFNFKDPDGAKIRAKKLTYLNAGALLNLKRIVTQVEHNKVKGIFIETGCALGGSTVQIGLAKRDNREFKVYDVFGMIPEPSEKDDKDVIDRFDEIKSGKSKGIKGDGYYGYQDDLIKKVEQTLGDFNLPLKEKNIHLVQGLYEDTLKVNEPVAFAHIDCDWYDSVMLCLEQIEPNLSKNGIMVLDDYYDWSGCRKAVDDYFTAELRPNYDFEKRFNKLIIKKLPS